MKTLTFSENLSGSENHKGWTMRVDGVRIGEVYPQDEDGFGGAANVSLLINSMQRAAVIEDLLVRLANKSFGAGHGEITEADRLAIVAALDNPEQLSALNRAKHNSTVI